MQKYVVNAVILHINNVAIKLNELPGTMGEERRKNRIPRIEVLLIGVFFLSVIMWSMARCSRQRQLMRTQEVTMKAPDSTLFAPKKDTALPPTTTPHIVPIRRTRLYVTINNLKLRAHPSLKGQVIATLPLYEEVFFLDEVTSKRDTINLGYEVAIEPWVKVRTQKGKVGWVYGAGVDFYKYKRSGVLE